MGNQSNNLMSKSATEALRQLISDPEVDSMEKVPNFETEFPTLFKGLGPMKEKYKILLKENAGPVHLCTPTMIQS